MALPEDPRAPGGLAAPIVAETVRKPLVAVYRLGGKLPWGSRGGDEVTERLGHLSVVGRGGELGQRADEPHGVLDIVVFLRQPPYAPATI